MGGGGVSLGVLARAAVQGNEGIDAHAEADGNGVDQVLHRKHQRQRRHGLLADAGHEKAVHKRAFTIMEITMGSAMDTSSGNTGRSFIN